MRIRGDDVISRPLILSIFLISLAAFVFVAVKPFSSSRAKLEPSNARIVKEGDPLGASGQGLLFRYDDEVYSCSVDFSGRTPSIPACELVEFPE